MKKIKTYFGYEGTFVLSSCLAIYAISVWLLENFYRREFERHANIKIHCHHSPKEIFRSCSLLLNVKSYEK